MSFYTVDQFAKMLSLSDQTVRKLIRNGRISAIRVSDKGRARYRIPESQLEIWQIKSSEEQQQLKENTNVR